MPIQPAIDPSEINSPTVRWRGERWLAAAALLIALLSFANIQRFPLLDPDEFDYITAARQMATPAPGEPADWITPHFNGEPRIVKPIPLYWIMAGSFKLFGVHVAIARLCSAAAAAMAVFMVFLSARHLLGNRPAWFAALFSAGHLSVLQLSHVASVDPTLWAFTSIANFAFVKIVFDLAPDPATTTPPIASDRLVFGYLFFLATALALLTKGLPALAWCGIPFLWPLVRREWAVLKRFPWLGGLICIVALVAPWASVFLYHNWHQVKAMLGDASSHESIAQFASPINSLRDAGRIVPQIVLSMLPWIPLAVVAVASVRTGGFSRRIRCLGFLVFWLASLLIILTAAHNKSIRYMLTPIMPTSLLLAGWFDSALDRKIVARGFSAAAMFYGIFTTLLAVPLIILVFANPHEETRWLWVHIVLLGMTALILLRNFRSPRLHAALPAVMVALLYSNIFFAAYSVPPLAGTTVKELAPLVERSLAPDQPIVMASGMSGRYFVYYAHRSEKEIRTLPQLIESLGSIQACFVTEADWNAIPLDKRADFEIVGHCVMQKSHAEFTPVLERNRERVLLVARKPR